MSHKFTLLWSETGKLTAFSSAGLKELTFGEKEGSMLSEISSIHDESFSLHKSMVADFGCIDPDSFAAEQERFVIVSDWSTSVLNQIETMKDEPLLQTPEAKAKVQSMAAVWELVKLCYETPDNFISTSNLVLWFRLHQTLLSIPPDSTESHLQEQLIFFQSEECPEESPEFWESLLYAVRAGWTDMAASFLRLHSASSQRTGSFLRPPNSSQGPSLIATLASLLDSFPLTTTPPDGASPFPQVPPREAKTPCSTLHK